MHAAFRDFAVFEHIDAIGIADGGEAVRNDDERAGERELPDAVPDLALAFDVYAGGGFIKNDVLLREQGARDADLLALTAGEAAAGVADGRV